MLYEHTAALAADFVERLIPRREITVRIFFAAIEDFAGLSLALDKLAAAFGAFHANLDENRLSITAVREAWAREELAEAAFADNHHLAAFIARNVGNLQGNLDMRNFFLRYLQILSKRIIEAVQYSLLRRLMLRDFVEVSLHLCGERNAD